MATFTYDAKDGNGKTVSGLIEASEPRGAAASLREQGLWPTRIEPMNAARPAVGHPPAGQAPAHKEIAPFLNTVPLPLLSMMYGQLATLLDAGVPIFQAVGTLADQTQHPRLRKILREAADAINNGHPFSATLERYPSVFSPIQIELVRAGEVGGMLVPMIRRLAGYIDKDIEIRRKLKRETLYPKIVLSVAGMVILLLAYIRYQAQGVVTGLTFAAVVAGTIFGVWWLARYLNQYSQIGTLWDYVRLSIPGMGKVTRQYATARFARSLGALYAGGTNLTRAVEISARACGNRAIGERLLANAGALNSGEGLARMLERSRLLSPLAVQMARTGEQTGNLDTMMDKVADYLEGEADLKSHQYALVLGVVALFIAAAVVLLIAVSFYGGALNNAVNSAGD